MALIYDVDRGSDGTQAPPPILPSRHGGAEARDGTPRRRTSLRSPGVRLSKRRGAKRSWEPDETNGGENTSVRAEYGPAHSSTRHCQSPATIPTIWIDPMPEAAVVSFQRLEMFPKPHHGARTMTAPSWWCSSFCFGSRGTARISRAWRQRILQIAAHPPCAPRGARRPAAFVCDRAGGEGDARDLARPVR
jgi:hypothetical protein